jgi:hypothetical protein
MQEVDVNQNGSVVGDGNGLPPGIVARTTLLESQLAALLRSPSIPFDDRCRSAIPEHHGIYRISDRSRPDDTVRAGRTKSAAGGLRQRVYQNHLMGNQAGNLRAQLVAGGICQDLAAAKAYVRDQLVVQVLVVPGAEDRRWLEHFMLGVLMPQFCD